MILRVAYRWLLSKAPPQVVFTEVLLEDPEDLLRWWKQEVGTDLLPKTHAHHMTLHYKPPRSLVQQTVFGESVRLQVVGYAEDEQVQVVVLDSPLSSDNLVQHVTVATDGVAPPKYSNDLLRGGFISKRGPSLKGVVGYFDGRGHRTN